MTIRDPIEEAGPEPPPCECGFAHSYQHPRYPSGDCIICGARCTEGCKHVLAVGEYEPIEE